MPVAVGASSEWRLGSWDGFRIPRPFARCVARFGEPILVARVVDRRAEEVAREEVEAALRALSCISGPRGPGLMYALYSAMLALALAAYSPFFFLRRFGRGGYGHDFGQRLGRIEPGLPAEPRCWIHAVSVGEAAAAAPLVRGIRGRWPALGIVVTTVTPTGARIVAGELGRVATHRYFPIDLPGPVRRALGAVRPRFFVGMETELWPNFLRALALRGVPSMIANGRISDRSFKRYRLVRPLVARMLARVTVFAMQSEEDARRIIALGAPAERVVVTGNLKTDLVPAPSSTDWEALLGLGPDDLLWIAGSTHRGEEAAVLDVFERVRPPFPALRLVLAPRHPERAAEVERLILERGLRPVRRTALGPGGAARGAVVILDTVGELADLYRLAAVVFVGGSLVPVGGHNMLEPALRKKPVLYGPHATNFRDSAALLESVGASVVVADTGDLERQMTRLLAPSGHQARDGRGRLRRGGRAAGRGGPDPGAGGARARGRARPAREPMKPRTDPSIRLRRYWENPDTPVVTAGLAALSVGYRAALTLREAAYRVRLLGTGRLACPVISIGNITLGGSGKTPVTELAVRTLRELGGRPAVVSRGYGRHTRGVHVVADREGSGSPPTRRGTSRDCSPSGSPACPWWWGKIASPPAGWPPSTAAPP